MVLNRPVLIELIKLTLNHGAYSMRAITTLIAVANALSEWQRRIALLDMDLEGVQMTTLLRAEPVAGIPVPIIGLTRRGDLKNNLAAFESGVDDILTVPFAPEELLAQVIAVLRRSYSDAVTFTPVIKLGISVRSRRRFS